jgi:hypothetical protein
MVQFYSDTTVVQSLTRIRRDRLLPYPGEVAVRVGQEVTPVQVVARATEETGFYILRADTLLEVPAPEVAKYLLVEEGAALQRGMPILRKKGFLGRARQIKSPVDGVLYRVSNGCLILQQAPNLLELRAGMQATVVSHIGSRGVTLETNGTLIQGLWDSGKDGHGKIKVVASSPIAPLQANHLGSDARGAIVVAGHASDADILVAAEENGVRGLIVGSMPAELCLIAGTFTFPVVITDGIGNQPMAEPILALLQQSEERSASLFSCAGQAAGCRTEIIIPLPVGYTDSLVDPRTAIAVGQTVRIRRAPYDGRTGKVKAAYSQAKTTAIGLRTVGADVEFADGEVVFIPYSNLDLIL